MSKNQKPSSTPKERELDKEPEQEFEDLVEYEREHRDTSVRDFGELSNDDYNADVIEEDPGEFDQEKE